MPYSHFGEIGDIWKHLPLCYFLSKEQPARYVESNSAYPMYMLNRTDERNYGIYYLLEQLSIRHYEHIAASPYLQIVKGITGNEKNLQNYLGSPGLALEVLKEYSHYVFCDIEDEPLQHIMNYAKQSLLDNRIQTVHGDSIEFLWHEIEKMGKETFLHIDPYRIFEMNKHGRCYFDLFVKAIQQGIKTMLWYGFESLEEQERLHARMRESLLNSRVERFGIDIFIEGIGASAVNVNPGVPGCGIMIANLSASSVDHLKQYAKELEEIYQYASYLDKPARLTAVEINVKA
ncbi:23S rRNA (adenine(2030)-N(6))-methyltransferase RlmJ [Paenibacillus solisilvae]|uniref:23S rRNA (Adenine(2030)-N(6))-methyltransferase RlmJ n=1 Tax=Paenibacillus solisilvae TaxID=2486751 RepID=A0ABW0W217_9BACL